MHGRGVFEDVRVLRVKTQGLGDQPGVTGDAQNMVPGVFIAILTGPGEAEKGLLFAQGQVLRRFPDFILKPTGTVASDNLVLPQLQQVMATGAALEVVDGF